MPQSTFIFLSDKATRCLWKIINRNVGIYKLAIIEELKATNGLTYSFNTNARRTRTVSAGPDPISEPDTPNKLPATKLFPSDV